MTMKFESIAAKSERGTRKCLDCGAVTLGTPQTYHYTECGLASVELLNVVVYRCGKCKAVNPEIRAIEQLHVTIAIAILTKDSLLSGEEIRFLRKMAGLTQAELAEVLGTDSTRPSKWESSRENIGGANDRALRSCCLFGLQQRLLNSRDPMPMMRSAARFIREVDVKELFKEIGKKSSGSRKVTLEGSGDANEPWILQPVKCQDHHVN